MLYETLLWLFNWKLVLNASDFVRSCRIRASNAMFVIFDVIRSNAKIVRREL